MNCLQSTREKRLHTWYREGADLPPLPAGYYHAHNDGPECRQAYLAGVIARAFGVDLSEAVL